MPSPATALRVTCVVALAASATWWRTFAAAGAPPEIARSVAAIAGCYAIVLVFARPGRRWALAVAILLAAFVGALAGVVALWGAILGAGAMTASQLDSANHFVSGAVAVSLVHAPMLAAAVWALAQARTRAGGETGGR